MDATITPPTHFATADWVVINSSGGKDSQAMLTRVVAAADAVGIPRSRLVVVHADLHDMEWPGTKELAAEQAAHYGLRFEVVTRVTKDGEQQDLLQQVEARGMWPSSTARYCTSDHKRGPIMTLFTRLVAESKAAGVARKVVIVNCLGLRAEESPARSKKVAYERNTVASNGKRDVYNWLPIHHWTTDQVWAEIKASGVRSHPAYERMGRLSCMFCIFAPREALAVAGQANPELLARYVAVEKKIGHKFRVSLTMADVAADVASGKVPERVSGSWCGG